MVNLVVGKQINNSNGLLKFKQFLKTKQKTTKWKESVLQGFNTLLIKKLRHIVAGNSKESG